MLLLGRSPGSIENVLRHPGKRFGVGFMIIKLVRGIHEVLLELRLRLGQFLRHTGKSLPGVVFECNACEAKVSQGVSDELTFDCVAGADEFFQFLESPVKLPILRDFGTELRYQRQAVIVCGSKFVARDDGVQVSDRAPYAMNCIMNSLKF